jgi:hypothetical protein
MNKLSIVLVAASLAFGIAACGKDKGGAASCDAVVAKMTDMMGKQMTSEIPADKKELADKMQAKIKTVMLVSCKEDQWPEEVKKCIMEANDEKAMDECGDKGGKEFEDKVRQRLTPVMEEMMKEMAAAMGMHGGEPAGGEGGEGAEGGEGDEGDDEAETE